MYTLLLAAAGYMGVNVAVELPADRAIKEIRIEMAQNYENREQQYQQQQAYHLNDEKDKIRYRLKTLTAEINRLNKIPTYLNRPLTPEEAWEIEQAKGQWNILQERLDEISH